VEISQEVLSKLSGINEVKVYTFFSEKSINNHFRAEKADWYDLMDIYSLGQTRAISSINSLIKKGIVTRLKKGYYKFN
jgi:predicted transcriptional regulator